MKSLRLRIHTRSPYPQNGYVLLTTLVAMLVCTLIVGSLLAVTRSVNPVEETGRVREKQARAAESAIQLAINQIRNNPSIASAPPLVLKKSCNPGFLTGPPVPQESEQLPKTPGDLDCDGAGPDEAYAEVNDPNVNRAALNGACNPLGSTVEVDGYPVRVFCYNEGLRPNDGQGGSNVPDIPRDDGALAVRLVGDEYTGEPTATDPLADQGGNSITDRARIWKNVSTGFPFGGILSASQIADTRGQLLHTGAVPLQVVGGVEVRNQVAAVTSTGIQGPAIDAQGWVRQGGKGLGQADISTDPLDCGPSQATAALSRAAVSVRSNVVAPADKMLCSQNDLAGMAQGGTLIPGGDWSFQQVAAERYVDWDGDPVSGFGTRFRYGTNPDFQLYDADRFRVQTPPVPNDPWLDCNTYGDVITIPQGSYDKYATRVLNGWFSGVPGETCTDKTYVFEGGVYHFDVFDPSRAENDPRRHSLVFAERSSNWIFGKPTYPGNETGQRPNVEDFPNVCQRTNASAVDGTTGASIILSSRTGLHHTAGRVAICGEIGVSGPHNTAIFQRQANSLGVRLLPTALSGAGWSGLSADGSVLRNTDGSNMFQEFNVPPQCWDNGDCTVQSSFTASFAPGAVNGQASPGTVSSFAVDLVANGGNRVENPNRGGSTAAWTRFNVTLGNSVACSMEYRDPYRPRLTSNGAFTTYDLRSDPTNDGTFNTDGINGDCDTVLASVDRSAVYGSTVQVTFQYNPPRLRNTKFAYFDSWPWPLNRLLRAAAEALCVPIITGWNAIAGALANFTSSVISFLTGNAVALNWLADVYSRCDDRPPRIRYEVDSIALRTGWSPQVVEPVNSPNPTESNQVSFTTPASGVPEPTATSAYATASITAAQPAANARLRYTLRDPNLQDGFLPMDEVTFRWKIDRSGGQPRPNDRVVFTLKTTTGVWCTRSIALADVTDDAPQQFLQNMPMRLDGGVNLQPTSGDPRTDNTNRGRCQRVGAVDSAWPAPTATSNAAVDVGELVTHWDDTDVSNTSGPLRRREVRAFLDVEVRLDNSSSPNARSVGIDWVTFSATAGDRDASGLRGYPRPKDPFTVTWSPRTFDSSPGFGAQYGRAGDATFNVWGPVSVPNNDVRVIWNYGPNMLGQVGYPIFNAGRRQFLDCGPTRPERCQPALIASALGSWTTGTWPSPVAQNQLPDPLAGTGDSRPAFRTVRLVACVLDDSGATSALLPRANSRVIIADRQGKAFVPGAEVIVDDNQRLRSTPYRQNTAANPTIANDGACNPLG